MALPSRPHSNLEADQRIATTDTTELWPMEGKDATKTASSPVAPHVIYRYINYTLLATGTLVWDVHAVWLDFYKSF